MSTYILIHGAWHASWCWEKITPRLEQAGHTVYTPDLPGHGSNLIPFANIRLQTYVDYIGQLIDTLAEPVILVGHSMAGIIITQLAERYAPQIKQLVYVTAFLPQQGEGLLDITKTMTTPGVSQDVIINQAENSITLKMSSRLQEIFYHCCTENDAENALQRLQPEPLAPFADQVTVDAATLAKVAKHYIECTQDVAVPITSQHMMHQRVRCEVSTIDTDHSPFYSSPDELTASLLTIANQS